jgi:hypothetical protein
MTVGNAAKFCAAQQSLDFAMEIPLRFVLLGVATLCLLGLGLGDPRVELNKCFVCNKRGKMPGGGKKNLQPVQKPIFKMKRLTTKVTKEYKGSGSREYPPGAAQHFLLL